MWENVIKQFDVFIDKLPFDRKTTLTAIVVVTIIIIGVIIVSR